MGWGVESDTGPALLGSCSIGGLQRGPKHDPAKDRSSLPPKERKDQLQISPGLQFTAGPSCSRMWREGINNKGEIALLDTYPVEDKIA